VLPGRAHDACQNCLILIGPTHRETLMTAALLPVYTDSFDEDEGIWWRGVVLVPSYVCGTCAHDLERAPQHATLRLAPVSRAARVARARAWLTTHAPVHKGLRPGAYLRRGAPLEGWLSHDA
jgi:hypothetical protein